LRYNELTIMRFLASCPGRLRSLFFAIGFLALPVVVHAQSFGDRVLSGAESAGQPSGLTETGSLEVVVGDVIGVALSLLGVLLLLIMLYAGFLWMTAAGEVDQVKKARSMMINAVIGLVIVFGAYALTEFVLRSLTGAVSGGGDVDS
jgi:hypothetical protein